MTTTRSRDALAPTYRHFYTVPFRPVRAEGVTIWDEEGRPHLDVYNNVPHVGHCDPTVTDAVARQIRTLNVHSRYHHPAIVEYAERLTALMPAHLSTVFFTCSGSEANDLAIRLAREYTGARGVLASENAYHGNTQLTSGISPSLGVALDDALERLPAPGRLDVEAPATHLTAETSAAVARLEDRGLRPAALFVDPIFSSDGIHLGSPELLEGACRVVRDAGGLVVADEVQTGFGRLGGTFWGFEHYAMAPDVVVLGKPIGNGYPMAAVVTRPEIAAALKLDRFFSTFGGTPTAAAAGMAVLDVMQRDRLQRSAQSVGRRLREGLDACLLRHPAAHAVRGDGLYFGLELRSDGEESSQALTTRVVDDLRVAGFLTAVVGERTTVKIRPPMPFSAEHADRFLAGLDQVLSAAAPQR